MFMWQRRLSALLRYVQISAKMDCDMNIVFDSVWLEGVKHRPMQYDIAK